MTDTRPLTSRELARRLLEREIGAAEDPAVVAASMQRVCTRVSDNLRRAVGDDGHSALLARALARTEPHHPALANVHRMCDTGICLDGVAATVSSRGLPVVGAALEALLAALIETLSGLIGADMVANLVDHESPPSLSA